MILKKKSFEVYEQFSFQKNFGKCSKTQVFNLVKREKARNYLVSQPNYHTTINMNMNKGLYLGLPILKLIKTVM